MTDITPHCPPRASTVTSPHSAEACPIAEVYGFCPITYLAVGPGPDSRKLYRQNPSRALCPAVMPIVPQLGNRSGRRVRQNYPSGSYAHARGNLLSAVCYGLSRSCLRSFSTRRISPGEDGPHLHNGASRPRSPAKPEAPGVCVHGGRRPRMSGKRCSRDGVRSIDNARPRPLRRPPSRCERPG